MGQSYRIRTEIGINKTINVQLDQDFDFIELLSLKLQQEDIYTRSCADYGVLVGRVTANNGFGLPNARVSIFIPIENVDESNPLITSIYPYKSPEDKNEDGYRYNLLPYEKSYSKHAATGTLPTRLDVLTSKTAIEIYDKYYKFTAKTNESGDYMIMGVPLGNQTVVMDVDLSDIGEFSLTPQDLIRMGLATDAQVAGNQFLASNDLSSLPQLVTLNKTIDVSPLWGEPDICQIAINRVDFDLRDEANIDIQPTAVFMGSIYSSPDNFRIRRNCRPREALGNLCGLNTGPGQILALRQTIDQDSDGNPVLEQYQLEQAGNIIDGNGVWLTELPMNLDYFVTNEFGEKVVSNDPTIGIPTKAKYRFKIKWQQPNTLTQVTRRGYFLVPNVKEYGWINTTTDPSFSTNQTQIQQQRSSYYFGLDWTGYTEGFSSETKLKRLNEAINCEDTFYQFQYNKVYTVSGFIDEYKNGFNRGKFLGIKEIDSPDCESTVNKFPVNDGFRNFDLFYFIFSIIFQVIQLFGVPLLVIFHILAFLWNNFAVPLLIILIGLFSLAAIQFFISAAVSFPALGLIIPNIALGIIMTFVVIKLISNFSKIVKKKFGRFKIPMITYPECQACDCSPETTSDGGGNTPTSLLTQLSNSGLYYDKLVANNSTVKSFGEEDKTVVALCFSQSLGTRSQENTNNGIYKSTESAELRLPQTTNIAGTPKPFFSHAEELPLGERINIFNTRAKYFNETNKIGVCFDANANKGKKHFDNTITVLMGQPLPPGTLMTFVDPSTSKDSNYLWSAVTVSRGAITGIEGTPNRPGKSTVNIEYAATQNSNSTVSYLLSQGSTETNYKFPADVEYYQVVTAITVSDAAKIWSLSSASNNKNYFPDILTSTTSIRYNIKDLDGWQRTKFTPNLKSADYFDGFENQYITIFQRGVDPYSPIYNNKFDLGKIFGYDNMETVSVISPTRLNIPIQKLTNTSISVQGYSLQTDIFYPSYFFTPSNKFSAFTTSNVGYYGRLDANYSQAGVSKPVVYNAKAVVSSTANGAYSSKPSPGFYDLSEDLSGGSFYFNDGGQKPSTVSSRYYSPNLYPLLQKTPMKITDKTKIVLRTDRLPSSDYLDSSAWNYNPALLQQNLGFATYILNTDTEDFTSERFGSGASTYTPDVEDQIAANTLSSFDCINMVGLSCYSGNSTGFGIKKNCQDTDTVEGGCYVFMARPLVDLGKDLKSFAEWGYRFRFFYGLCRGVLAQAFMNNWVNGTLYAYPFQVDTTWNKKNQPSSRYCKDLIYFETLTNNFYYRSSPFNISTNSFIGRPTTGQRQPLNNRNLLYPTTIIDLGMKDSFYSEIIFDPSSKSYIMDKLDNTSYSDTSDLVNLFVISRITDEGFLQQLFSIFNKNNSLDQLFSRKERRIDGDLAQLLSINSEEGVTNFSPEYYFSNGQPNDPVVILQPNSNSATIGVFFSSNTEDLQVKDFITPGRIDFRSPNFNLYPFNFGIKSQVVPFYQWNLNITSSIFGDQYNSWATNTSDIFSTGYQSLDRISPIKPNYFRGSNIDVTNTDTYARGYIFNVVGNNNLDFRYSINAGNYPNKFLVGAPFHFYFGLIKGESALDKFKTKYSIIE